jgi:hypothetical protein
MSGHIHWGASSREDTEVSDLSKYPPAKPEALACEPLKAVILGAP